jgi:hypothetical protein
MWTCRLDAKPWLQIALVGCLLVLVTIGGAAAGPLEDGRAAYKRGDFAEAMRLWRPLAEQGNNDAQVDLASLYLNGNGAPQDYTQALIWERKAADRGNVFPQAALGAMFEFGRGAPQDNVQEFRGYRGTSADVTATVHAQEEHERLRHLESDLAHMNRLSVMGELTASLAHEITQPIAAARNNARAALNFLNQQPPNLGEVREAARLCRRRCRPCGSHNRSNSRSAQENASAKASF